MLANTGVDNGLAIHHICYLDLVAQTYLRNGKISALQCAQLALLFLYVDVYDHGDYH